MRKLLLFIRFRAQTAVYWKQLLSYTTIIVCAVKIMCFTNSPSAGKRNHKRDECVGISVIFEQRTKQMSNQDQHHKDIFQMERIALFSDAVFAIAITLLIIEVKVPPLPYSSAGFNREFPAAMREMIPEFIGFIISFMVIGNYWRSHHSTFNFVKDYDLKLIKINNWFLLTIVIMPFTTAFMSRYMFFQPFVIYCLNVIASGYLQIRMWKHVTSEKYHLHTVLPPGIKSYKTSTSVIAISCFFVAILIHTLPLAANWPGFLARLFLISIFIIDILSHRYYRKKYNLSNKY
jgi:uncharacterized membrane protein